MYKISIIIPVYNMEKYLTQCLTTVLNQTLFKESEVICINDGSSDSSAEILSKYEKENKNIIIINQQNTGVGIARNNGIRYATGEFIAFMDPDDYYIENNSLEVLYKCAKKHNVLICGGSLSEDHNDGKWIRKNFDGIYKKYTFKTEEKILYKDYQFDFGFYRFIYNREFLLQNDIFFPPYIRFQDPPFFVKAMITAGEFYAIPNYTYCYRYGHQHLIWDENRICALMKGHIDDLRMSAEAGLGELHRLTLHRLVNISRDCIAKGLEQESSQVLTLLKDAEDSIDRDILPLNCETTSVRQFFFEYFKEAQQNKMRILFLEEKLKKQTDKKPLKSDKSEEYTIKSLMSKIKNRSVRLIKQIKNRGR